MILTSNISSSLSSIPGYVGASDQIAFFSQGRTRGWRSYPAPWFFSSAGPRLGKLQTLGQDWDSYGARSVDPAAIHQAQQLLMRLAQVHGVPPPRIGATPDGHVALTWDLGGASLDVEIEPDGRCAYAFVSDRDPSKDVEQRGQALFEQIASLATSNLL